MYIISNKIYRLRHEDGSMGVGVNVICHRGEGSDVAPGHSSANPATPKVVAKYTGNALI